jgi:MFS family permease
MANDLGTFIAGEVARAEGDLQGARARALSVVGVAGGLVTLTTGFLALAAGSDKDFFPSGDRWILVVAVVLFVLAAIVALTANIPRRVTLSNAEGLKPLVDKDWDDSGWDKEVASLQVDYLISLRNLNHAMAWLLSAAIVFEIAGIATTAAMAVTVLRGLH